MSQTATATMTVVAVLNKQVANFSVLYFKLHNYHWFVKGKHFFTLHAKFQELYNEAAAYIDELAERVLAIKGKPVATMKDMLALSSIKEASGDENPDQMVKNIVSDFQTIISEIGRGIPTAEQSGDPNTADMLTDIQTALEKHVWMLEATLL
jgi:starvation-inducible DNA-binding protein